MTDNSAEDHPYLVGLTGGIGSGKSTIAAFFSELGVEVVDADTIARSVLNVYPELLQEIYATFGTDVKNSDGTLNRRKLGRLVFADHKKLDQLEQILHPKIRFLLLSHAYKATSAYVVVMVPLLFEKSLDVLMDRVLCIDLEEESQVTRTIERDGTTEDYVRLVMKRQISRWERRRRSQDILYNSGTEKFKRQLVRKFHDFYISEAKKMKIKCPTCGREMEWSSSNPYRPFCSERCKVIDLGAWLDEKMVIADVDNNLNDGLVTVQDVLKTKNTVKKETEE